MLWFWLGRLQCVLCLPVHYKLQYFPLSFAAIPKFGFIFASVHHFSVVYFSKSTFPVLKFLISQSNAVFTVGSITSRWSGKEPALLPELSSRGG